MPRLSIKRTSDHVLVAVCDAELLGKEFREGKLRLKIHEAFYDGEEASVKKCLEALKEATIANLVGSIVEEVIKAGLIDPSRVIRVQGVPHAQFVRF